ncbi:MAG: serine/threonine-protein kinase [Myxococcota bacterium]
MNPLDRLLIGQVIAERYLVTGLLAKGGMGRVYLGRQLSLDRPVVLKVLPGARDPEGRPAHQKRFMREASTCARLEHPNTVTIYDYGELDVDQGRIHLFYIAMEYVPGRSLSDVLKAEGRLSLERSLRLTWEIGRALREAHDKGVIHRDLKPSNVMVYEGVEGESIKVLDFGIAKVLEQTDNEAITLDNRIVGSPRYMAPEQILENHASPRSDIYSLGVLLYELLCGQVPFSRGGATQTMMAQVHQPVPAMATHGVSVPESVEKLVLQCLAKHPEERFENIGALFSEIRQLEWLSDTNTTEENTVWTLHMTQPPGQVANTARAWFSFQLPSHTSKTLLGMMLLLNLLIVGLLIAMLIQGM